MALADLVAQGAQDAHLTGKPEISFYRQAWKRSTNFSIAPHQLNYIGTFGENAEITIPIPSKGDLLSRVWIEADGIGAHQNNATGLFAGNANQPTEISLWIGGQPVVTLDSLFIQSVWNVLYNTTQGKASTALTTQGVAPNATGKTANISDHYVLPFFFGDDFTRCLPLVAMQYSAVEIKIKCRDGFTPATTPKVYAEYVMLDTDEREFFTKNDHSLLINQVQHQLADPHDTEFDLSYFNHPIRAVHIASGKADGQNWDDEFTFGEATCYVNGVPISEKMSANYHHTIVPANHCSILPEGMLDNVPVFTFPFSLDLSRTQPTGSINASRLDNFKISITSPSGGVPALHRVYAVNYNWLRVSNGLAGCQYSN